MGLDGVYAEHRVGLFRYLAHLSGDVELAEDVVQETFVRLADRPPPTDVPVKTWLFRIGTSLVREAMRKRNRRLRLLRRSANRVPLGNSGPLPDVALERDEIKRIVRKALAGVTHKQRTILLMREEGFSHREIAKAVGTTTGSVGTLYARALKKLSQILVEQGEIGT